MKSEKLECWWGLSYASWLTLPRIFMQDMPKEWQDKMADLLNEYDERLKTEISYGTRVQLTKDERLTKTPKWLLNYRRPDRTRFEVDND